MSMTKSELMAAVAEAAGVEKKIVSTVLEALATVCETVVSKKDGEIKVPNIVKLKHVVKDVKAIKKGTMVYSMQKKEEVPHPGRPAGKKSKIKATPLGLVRNAHK